MRNPGAVFAGLLLSQLLIGGSNAGSVQVGGESKPDSGKLLQATAGDVACYLDFEDDNGDRFSEMAVFELCEDEALLGQWFHLEYRMESVLAASCQGDPECQDSEQVPLIHAMHPVDADDADEDGADADADDASAHIEQRSHCQPAQQVMFSCAIGSRLLSVCASGKAQLNAVEYRYGKPGQDLEMQLPRQPGVPNPSVYGRTEMYSGGGGSWIRFGNGNVAYVVYEGIGRWGKGGAPMEKSGVAIEQNGKLLRNLPCDNAPKTQFSAEFFERMGADPARADDFTFPD